MTIYETTASSDRPQAIPVVGETLRILATRMGKIAQAVVLITTTVPDSYQVSMDLIDHTTRTMVDVYDLEYAPELATTADVFRVSTGLRHIIDLCELCHVAGIVSDMNYQILVNELQNTHQFVNEKLMTYCIGHVAYPLRVPEISSGTKNAQQVSLEQYFIQPNTEAKKTEQIPLSETKPEREPTEFFTKVSRTFIERTEERETPMINRHPAASTKENLKVSHKLEPRIPSPMAVKPFSGEDKKDRRDAIMKTIRSKGQVTIKDISENIRGCSEKTIQRDLQELIQHGVLIREGEKRWAVYKLAMKNV